MSDTQQSYVQSQIARLDRNQAENDKLRAEEIKLQFEELRLRAEERKLRFERLRLERHFGPWLAPVSFLAGLIGLIGGFVTVLGLVTRAACRAG